MAKIRYTAGGIALLTPLAAVLTGGHKNERNPK